MAWLRFATTAALAASLLLIPSATAADWLMVGYDAARTGNTSDQGPATNDVAFRLRLGGTTVGAPIIVGDFAYVRTADQEIDPSLTFQGVYRIDLETGTWTEFFQVPNGPGAVANGAMTSDGTRLFVPDYDGISSFRIDDGTLEWHWSFAPPAEHPDRIDENELEARLFFCQPGAVHDDSLFVGCSGFGRSTYSDTMVARFFVDTPQPAWIRWWTASEFASNQIDYTQESMGDTTPGPSVTVPVLEALTIVGNTVGVVLGERGDASSSDTNPGEPVPEGITPNVASDARESRTILWALNAADGATRWTKATSNSRQVALSGTREPILADDLLYGAVPTGTETTLYTRFDILMAFNPASGDALWDDPDIGNRDEPGPESGSGFGLVGDTLYATSGQTLYAYNTVREVQEGASWTLVSDTREGWSAAPLVTANGTLYGRSWITDDSFRTVTGNAIYAFDASNLGPPKWRHEFLRQHNGTSPSAAFEKFLPEFPYAIGDGKLVVAGRDGWVTILGATAASPVPEFTLDSPGAYPPVGHLVRANLAQSEAGSGGPPTSFKADWGDGTLTEWQTQPILAHSYAAPGDRVARFQVRNDAGQTASSFITFHVGGQPPPELNAVQVALDDEHVDKTFFVVGLLITIIGAAIGFVRLRRRRGRLGLELAAIETAHATAKGNPIYAEAAMAERRARARGLLLDGKLDEGQVALLEKRIEELGRTARMELMDERLDFLPMGMVRAIKRILQDGHVTRWEHDHFLKVVDADEILTPTQKKKVRDMVASWFRVDGTLSK